MLARQELSLFIHGGLLMKNNQGQGLVELVFAVGIVILVLTGVVSLMTTSLKSKTSGFERKKAAELGQKVMDQIISTSKTDPTSFWTANSSFWTTNLGTTISGSTQGYSGYNYAISRTQKTTPAGCDVGFSCLEVTVGVGWSGAVNQSLTFSRLFTKN